MILMDMQMPKTSGVDASLSIRKLPGRTDVPIVAMTANAFTEDREKCLAAGMNDFVTKPVAPEVMFRLVYRWPKSRRIRSKARPVSARRGICCPRQSSQTAARGLYCDAVKLRDIPARTLCALRAEARDETRTLP